MRSWRLLASALLAPCLVLTLATPAPAQPFPHTIPLPVDFAPEGVTVGTGTTFYAGSLVDGDIFRGDLRTGEGEVFVDVSGRMAAGLKVHQSTKLLFVAGGPTGQAYVYDTRDGSTVADLTLAPGAFINDVTVTRDAAYFTDSSSPVIYKVPISPRGTVGAPVAIPVTGPAAVVGGFGLNGIDAPPNGSVLLVNLTDLGALALVDPETGVSQLVEVTGGDLVAGTLDGLILRGRTVWVVQNFANSVAEVRLSPDLTSGTLVRTITDPAFEVPTTVALHGSRLVLVNARFDLGLPPPFGPGAPPGTEFDVVLVRR